MTDRKTMRETRQRIAEAVTQRPAIAHGAAITTAVIEEGFRCDVREGDWHMAGDGTAPTPGFYGRGALASCLAMGIAAIAADRDIDLGRLTVAAEATWDGRGELPDHTDVRPGYKTVRLTVSADGPVTPAELEDIVARASGNSPYVDIFANRMDVRIEITVPRIGG